jgi:hypothetical protein
MGQLLDETQVLTPPVTGHGAIAIGGEAIAVGAERLIPSIERIVEVSPGQLKGALLEVVPVEALVVPYDAGAIIDAVDQDTDEGRGHLLHLPGGDGIEIDAVELGSSIPLPGTVVMGMLNLDPLLREVSKAL